LKTGVNSVTKILVIDDEPAIRDLLELILKREKFQVAVAVDGKSALKIFDTFNPDLVILDLMLPDIDGHDVCKEMTRRRKTPIMMLTAKNDIVDKVLGLELGADDYITKPFDGRELIARIKAVLRRLGRNVANNEDTIVHLDLEVNLKNKRVVKNGVQIELTLREYQLLELFVKNPQRVFSREELLSKAWGYDFMGDSRAVDINITRLRKKIEDDSANPRHILTVYGFGYRFGGANSEI
jgi:DNA-binding response OmpR family regulator